MSAATHKLKSALFTKNFIFGLGIAALFYAVLLFGSAFLNESSLKTMASKLASETVSVIRNSGTIQHVQSNQSAPSTPASATQPSQEEHHADGHHSQPPKQSKSAEPLPLKPVSGLYEVNSKGVLLPIIRGSDNLTPFQAYSAPFVKKDGASLIALVIDDFGLGGAQNSVVEKLPQHSSFIVSPYSGQAKSISKSLLQKGHEIWIKAPFETINFPEHDPGPKGILKRSSLNINQDNLKWVMGQAEVYAGIAAYTDTVFSGSNPTVNTLAREIMNRGLGFFETNVGAMPQIKDIAEKLNTPYTKNDIILHDQKWNGQFNEALDLLENIAQSRGTAVAVLRPHPQIIDMIDQWSRTLTNKNIQIAPLSAVILERSPYLTAKLVANPDMNTAPPPNNQTQSTSHDDHSNSHH